MIKKQFVLLLLALVAVAISGCVPNNSSQQIQNLYSRIDSTDRKVEGINKQMGISESGVVPGQAEMWQQMQSMRQDLNLIKGQLDDINGPSGTGAQDLAALRDRVGQLDQNMAVVGSVLGLNFATATGDASAVGTTPPATATSPQTATQATQTPPPVTATPMEQSTDLASTLYNNGTKAFSEKRYADAVKIFNDFIENYPSHNLVSNAYFWRGESYYQLKNYSNAIMSYQKVIADFPTSNKLQSSMFKQGVAMYDNNQKDAGKVRLNELIRKYPNSPEATRAKQYLSTK